MSGRAKRTILSDTCRILSTYVLKHDPQCASKGQGISRKKSYKRSLSYLDLLERLDEELEALLVALLHLTHAVCFCCCCCCWNAVVVGTGGVLSAAAALRGRDDYDAAVSVRVLLLLSLMLLRLPLLLLARGRGGDGGGGRPLGARARHGTQLGGGGDPLKKKERIAAADGRSRRRKCSRPCRRRLRPRSDHCPPANNKKKCVKKKFG